MSAEMNPVNWFEIPATDIKRAKKFYEGIFEVELSIQDFGPIQMGFFPMVDGGTGSSGSLVEGESYTPSHAGSLVYFSVVDIEKTLDKISEKGGKVLNPKSSIGEFGFVAHFEDTEGNRVALHSDN